MDGDLFIGIALTPGISAAHFFSDLNPQIYRHLALVLEFIYRGRVNMPQDELNDFLGVAKNLQIPLEDIDDRPAPSPTISRPSPPVVAKRSTPQPERERVKRPKMAMGPRKVNHLG